MKSTLHPSFPDSWRHGGGPKNAFRFGGGGGSAPAAPNPALTAVPTPTPPITPSNKAVIDIQQATRRESLRRKGISSTVYAGATGGWFPTVSSTTVGAMPQAGSGPSLGNMAGKTG